MANCRSAAVALALLASACADAGLAPGEKIPEKLADAPRTAPAARSAAAPAVGAKEALIAEARALRRAGDKAAAARTLERAAKEHPKDIPLMKERGLLALELGQVGKAETLLRKVLESLSPPDWRVHSGLGTALAASGKQQDAQLQFAKALELAPEHPAIINNLALSYALDGKAAEAEKLLRRVTAGKGRPRETDQAKQNLALLLGLSGRIEEARTLSAATLPAEQAKANVEYLKSAAAEPAQTPSGQQGAVAAARNLPAPTYQLGGKP